MPYLSINNLHNIWFKSQSHQDDKDDNDLVAYDQCCDF